MLFQYVTPSHPQTGVRIGSSVVPTGLHVPIPHPGASQYMPAPHGSVALHWHVAPPELLLVVLVLEVLVVLDELLVVLEELLLVVLEELLVVVLEALLLVLDELLLPPPLPLDVDEEPPALVVSTLPPQAASATSHVAPATTRRGLTADPGSAWRALRPRRRAPWPRRPGCAACRRARG